MPVSHRTATPDDADLRLDRWFRRHYPQLTQGVLQKLLRTGQIRLDGKRAEADTRVAAGQAIRIPPLPEGPAPEHLRPRAVISDHDAKAMERLVLYRDAAVIALDKPPGLAVQGGPGIARNLDAMLDALRFDAAEKPRLVHRLDRDTSGVMVVARTAAAAASLARAFRGREARKVYWAIVVGEPVPREGRIDLSLVRQEGPRGERTSSTDDPTQGARAITDFRTLDAARRRAAWLELRPLTGRTHQLRVHCAAALACPILGDGKYGGAAAHLEGMAPQLHLHARALSLPHPDGGTLDVEAPLPAHLRESFGFLGFEAPRPMPARRLVR